MATSRFGSNGDTFTGGTTQQTTVASGGSTTTDTSATAQSQSGSSASTETVNMDFMSASGRQALDSLLAQLAAGGTPEQRAIQEDILRTMQRIKVQQVEFSKDAAFRDADNAMALQLQRAMETALPSVLLAGESAGTSGDALSALLTQDLATRAAGESAQLGLGAAVDYGNISANLSQTLAGLANREDPAVQALIAALGVDKGSKQTGTSKTRSSNSSSSSSSTKSTQDTASSQTQRQNTVQSGFSVSDQSDARQLSVN